MELFDKFYNCYFQAVRHILASSEQRPVTRADMEAACSAYGFSESALAILPKLTKGDWPLLEEGRSVLSHRFSEGALKPPLTVLQKSWLKALAADRRIRLFLTDEELEQLNRDLEGVEPLFSEDDFHYFDRFRDGDDYESPVYREHFQTILQAMEEKRALIIAYLGRKGTEFTFEAVPCQFQYSSKDDKFRLCCLKLSRGHFCQNTILNLARIRGCHLSKTPVPEPLKLPRFKPVSRAEEPVLLEIRPQRNGLERCMLHFANYEKHTEYDEVRGVWLCSIYYDSADETELLIDILSFGPVVRVLGPEPFLTQLKNRIRSQHHLLYDPIPDPNSGV